MTTKEQKKVAKADTTTATTTITTRSRRYEIEVERQKRRKWRSRHGPRKKTRWTKKSNSVKVKKNNPHILKAALVVGGKN